MFCFSIKNISFALLVITTTASATEPDWRTSWDGTLYGYANRMNLRNNSILNPGNQVARLAERSDVAELRLNLKAENETVRFIARPISLVREMRNDFGTQQQNESYMSQWQVRVRAAESWNIAAGREVLNWGAAQFRSPASPFYFDNGRSDPMRALIGMDTLKITWTPDMQNSVNLARIVRSGYRTIRTDQWRDSWLAKFDHRGEAWSAGVVAVKTPHLPTFYGAHVQQTVNDALMLYGELGSSAQISALQSSADIAQPFTVQTPAPRHTTALIGTTYTFENGNALNIEYLHDDNGYNAAEQRAYFQRATAQPAMALGLAPRLLGRDYLHLVCLSNQMDNNGFWRLMFTHSLTDSSNQFAGYGEKTLTTRLSAIALGVWNIGNARQELSSLFAGSITLGLKVALP
ncbi:conserved exported hypothetical protein [Candidatus Nitrotoga sp. HW29]|uniref:hypothetical protein n=1 Tax=Candidatus Nitrotoga sp. HW29 TaxID=2886963 RepID=UPI001EF2D844|nr:hypothetical protein [Candidatus Nitrotoga sp. HW29]CAH1905067.1 conserved exported hypothetical protein [Candidatus Nitrotoga sp. HW29]